MNKRLVLCTTVTLCFVVLMGASPDSKPVPQFTADHQLLRPENYRDWMFLSSGYAMSYNAAASSHKMFTNVFVPQWAYKEFMASGKWPDQTTFIVEERMAESKGSINKIGNYQTDLMGIGVEVKDSRQPDTWAYYNFDENTSAKANPKAGCFQCHEDHAAVEHSFVQFYPTLKPVAQKYGTYRTEREKVE